MASALNDCLVSALFNVVEKSGRIIDISFLKDFISIKIETSFGSIIKLDLYVVSSVDELTITQKLTTEQELTTNQELPDNIKSLLKFIFINCLDINIMKKIYKENSSIIQDLNVCESKIFSNAFKIKSIEMISFLFEIFKPDRKNFDVSEFLIYVGITGDMAIFEMVNSKLLFTCDEIRANGNAMLEFACKNGRDLVVKFIIKNFSMSIVDLMICGGSTFLESICENGHLNVVRFLVNYFDLKADDFPNAMKLIHNSSKKKDEQMILFLINDLKVLKT